MVDDAYVNHIPTLTGGVGKEALREFYAKRFIPQMPPDTEMIPVSQTIAATGSGSACRPAASPRDEYYVRLADPRGAAPFGVWIEQRYDAARDPGGHFVVTWNR